MHVQDGRHFDLDPPEQKGAKRQGKAAASDTARPWCAHGVRIAFVRTNFKIFINIVFGCVPNDSFFNIGKFAYLFVQFPAAMSASEDNGDA